MCRLEVSPGRGGSQGVVPDASGTGVSPVPKLHTGEMPVPLVLEVILGPLLARSTL